MDDTSDVGWVVRAYEAADESCIASMWLRQLCHGQDARAAGYREAGRRGSDEQIAWWEIHQPIVTALLAHADVVVACDPDRADYAPGQPAVVYGWAATDGEVVLGCGIKRRFAKAGLASELAVALLGDRLTRPQTYALDLVDLTGMVPREWRREPGWASSLRQLSQRRLSGDGLYVRVAQHVVDPARAEWAPGSRAS